MQRIGKVALALVMAVIIDGSAISPNANAQGATNEARRTGLLPEGVAPPFRVETKNFTLVPLGPELAKIDYEAYMSSIDHLQRTFTRSTSWPHPGITDAEAMADMQTEQARFARRKSFAYAVLTPDGKRERGCVYVQPSPVAGYDAVVLMWVTEAEYKAGFDAELQAWVMKWIASDWPFKNVAYPGRTISWDSWDALVPARTH